MITQNLISKSYIKVLNSMDFLKIPVSVITF